MNAADLLTDLTRQGFTLTPEGAGVRVMPASRLTEELRGAIQAHKAELLVLLPRSVGVDAGDTLAQHRPSSEPARADENWNAELARVAALIDHQAARCCGLTDVQRRILSRDYRAVAEKYHRERNPMLFDLAGDILHQIRVIWELSPAEDGP